MIKLFKRLVWWLFAKVFPHHKVERLVNKPGNEMWRTGGGYHDYLKYFRIDWASRGWRFTRRLDYCADYGHRIYPSLTRAQQIKCDELMVRLNDEVNHNPDIKVFQVARCGQLMTERVDLWEKLWAHGNSLMCKP